MTELCPEQLCWIAKEQNIVPSWFTGLRFVSWPPSPNLIVLKNNFPGPRHSPSAFRGGSARWSSTQRGKQQQQHHQPSIKQHFNKESPWTESEHSQQQQQRGSSRAFEGDSESSKRYDGEEEQQCFDPRIFTTTVETECC